MENNGQPAGSASPLQGFIANGAMLLVAVLLGGASGALMAWIAPSDKFSLAGLAIAPLWLLLEALLEGFAGASFSLSKAGRAVSIMAALGGFYAAWFCLRPI